MANRNGRVVCVLLALLFLSAGVLSAGQEWIMPLPNNDELPVWAPRGLQTRLAVDVIHYDVDAPDIMKYKLLAPVFPPAKAPSVTGEVEDGLNLALRGGLGTFWGNEKVRLTAGLDLRLNMAHFQDGYKEGLEDSQYLPDKYGSNYGSYMQLVPDPISFIPRVGVEANIGENAIVGVEYGMPLSGFHMESGIDRFGQYNRLREDDWFGAGHRLGVSAAYQFTDQASIAFDAGYEFYRPEFKGEKGTISQWSIGLMFKFNIY